MKTNLDKLLKEENPRISSWISGELKSLKSRYEEIKAAESPGNYVVLPANDSHPVDIEVELKRLYLSPLVGIVQKELGLSLGDNEQGFIGNMNHGQALAVNSSLGGFTMPLYIGVEFLGTLMSGAEGRIKVYNGNGRKISQKTLEMAFSDITEQKNPFRGELFEDKYSLDSNGKPQNTCSKFNSKGKLIKVTELLDSDTLIQNRLPGIDLKGWINNPTPHPQGLPRSNVQSGSLYYWQPTEGRVAGFYADAGTAYLHCSGNPLYSDAFLGVRRAKIFKLKK